MWVLVAQRGESWSYSDTWTTPGNLDNKKKQKTKTLINEKKHKGWQLGLDVRATLRLSLTRSSFTL